MNYRFLLFLIFLIPVYVTAKPDSLAVTKHKEDSIAVEISKQRQALLEKFMEENLIKVTEMKNHLENQVANEKYAAFYPFELWLILYWTQEYNQMIAGIKEFDYTGIAAFQKKIKPGGDLLPHELIKKTRSSILMLDFYIRLSGLKPVDKDFLSMNLKYLVSGKDYPAITQDSLNVLADNFLVKYPESGYEKFIKKHIKFKYRASKWAFSAEFFSGYGIFTRNLEGTYKNCIPIGVAFDISYRKFVLSLRDYIGFSSTKNSIPYDNGVWEKGSQVRVYIPEAAFGYVVLESNRFRISPFLGIASTDIGPTQHDTDETPDLKEVELRFTTTYALGVAVDLKLGGSGKSRPAYIPASDFVFLRLRYGFYMPQFSWKYEGCSGNIHTLTLGIGFLSRKIKREL